LSILLIHTGGTIGMIATADGFAPCDGVVEGCIDDLLRCGEVIDEVTIRTITPQIDSANATPQDWNRVVRLIEQGYGHFDTFVVTHGTDTLAYTAAALCFAVEGLAKPVIVTGSMLPLTVAGSDGRDNLREALNTARRAPAGVWVQFAGKLCRAAACASRTPAISTPSPPSRPMWPRGTAARRCVVTLSVRTTWPFWPSRPGSRAGSFNWLCASVMGSFSAAMDRERPRNTRTWRKA
jgi:L-asparaginase